MLGVAKVAVRMALETPARTRRGRWWGVVCARRPGPGACVVCVCGGGVRPRSVSLEATRVRCGGGSSRPRRGLSVARRRAVA